GLQNKNWIARPYGGTARASWLSAGKLARRAGLGVSIGTAGLDQWMRDSGRADLSTSERVGRAADRATVAGGSAWIGATVGSRIGGAIGTAIEPGAGTVVGGVVGGIVGGVAGSGVGNYLADHSVDQVGHLAQDISDGVSSAAHGVVDAAGAAKGTVSHAIDKINPF
ncbi:MAG TPA: hypothetical protein VF069_00675, partial [Streptosporangiaceae bacterium]